VKNRKVPKRVKEKPFDPFSYQLRMLENTKTHYEQNPNLPSNVRMANVQLVQNEISAFRYSYFLIRCFLADIL